MNPVDERVNKTEAPPTVLIPPRSVPPVVPAPPSPPVKESVRATAVSGRLDAPRRSRLWIALVLMVLAGGAAALVYGLRRPPIEPPKLARVEPRALEVVLREIGTVDALVQAKLLSRLTGEIVWKEEEGKFVNAGDPVVRFDDTAIAEDIDNREKDLIEKEDNLKRTAEGLDIARARYRLLIRIKAIELKMARINRRDIYDYPDFQTRREAELSLESAVRELEKFTIELNAYEELYKRGFVTEASWRKRELDLVGKRVNEAKARLIHDLTMQGSTPDAKEVARLALADAKKSLAVTRLNRRADIANWKAALELSQVDCDNFIRELRKRRDQHSYTVVRAPFAGRVVYHNVYKGSDKNRSPIQVGESIAEGNELCTICDTSDLRVNVWINESDVGGVSEGQEARLKLPAFPGRTFGARVVSVSVTAKDKNAALSDLALRRSGEAFVNVVEVKLAFTDMTPAERDAVRIGYTAEVALLSRERAPVLTIPWTAVGHDAQHRPFADVARPGGGAERRMLTLGRADTVHVQVLDGVKEGDEVVVQATRPAAATGPAASEAR